MKRVINSPKAIKDCQAGFHFQIGGPSTRKISTMKVAPHKTKIMTLTSQRPPSPETCDLLFHLPEVNGALRTVALPSRITYKCN